MSLQLPDSLHGFDDAFRPQWVANMTIQGTYSSAGQSITAGRGAASERDAQDLTSLPQLDYDLTVLLMELGSADQNYLGFGRMAAAELIVACRLRA